MKYIVSKGTGVAEGMVCFTRATAGESTTGCDSPEQASKTGFTFSEERPDGKLAVTSYLPEGLATSDLGPDAKFVTDRIVEALIGRSQESFTATDRATTVEIPVPGSGPPLR